MYKTLPLLLAVLLGGCQTSVSKTEIHFHVPGGAIVEREGDRIEVIHTNRSEAPPPAIAVGSPDGDAPPVRAEPQVNERALRWHEALWAFILANVGWIISSVLAVPGCILALRRLRSKLPDTPTVVSAGLPRPADVPDMPASRERPER